MIVMPISLLIYGCKLAERTRIPQLFQSGKNDRAVHPAANAGAIFHVAISSGKFHGMILAIT
jgi:hypothetical protein